MENYFLALSESQRNKIQEAGIEFCELDLDGHSGVVVDSANIRFALEMIDSCAYCTNQSSLEGIVNVGFCPTNDLHKMPIIVGEPKGAPTRIEHFSSVEGERLKCLVEERHNKSRRQYMAECSKRFEKTIRGTRDKVSNGYCEIEKLQKQLTRKIRETRGAERKLSQLEACKDGELEKYGKEFDSLSAVPGVKDVQVSDGVIKVFTEHIYITPEGYSDVFDIGKFRMEIFTSGSNGGVKFFNITRKGGGGGHSNYNIHHPHVDGGGSPCLGNIKELVSQLIGEYEYSAVAQLGLQYLKTVNLNDSAGKGIFNAWPKKED